MRVVLLLAFALCASAKIEWPFKGVYESYYDNVYVYLSDVTIGTPGAKFNPSLKTSLSNWLGDVPTCPGLWISSSHIGPDGFNYQHSSTFKQLDTVYNSVFGQENLVIKSSTGANQQLKQKAINVVDRSGYCLYAELSDFHRPATLSLAHKTDYIDNAFLNSIFDTEQEQVAVLAFDNIPSFREDANFTGILTLGERPDACTNWVIVNEEKPVNNDHPQWNVKLDRFDCGKFGASKPGTVSIIDDKYEFTLPSDIYSQVLNALGGDQFGRIPCDSTIDLVFTVGTFKLTLTPKDYIASSNGDDSCDFIGSESDIDDYFTLPFGILRNHCLLFDYKNLQVGFADKKK